MVTAKGLIKEMKEAGFLPIDTLKEILSIECDCDEIERVIDKLKTDKEYNEFLVGNYKKCSCCKNLFINSCFYEVRAGQLRSECKICFNKKQKKNYADKRKEYNKRAYEKRKQRGITYENNVELLRKNRLKKSLFKRFDKKYNNKIITELLCAKYSSYYGIKNNILFNLCFDKEGNYLGINKLKEFLNGEYTRFKN